MAVTLTPTVVSGDASAHRWDCSFRGATVVCPLRDIIVCHEMLQAVADGRAGALLAIASQSHEGRYRPLYDRTCELGPLGERRSARHDQSDHAGQAETGCGAGAVGRIGVAFAHGR